MHSKQARDAVLSVSLCYKRSDRNNVYLTKYRHWILFSGVVWVSVRLLPVLGEHILNVVFLSAKPKVVWSTAWRIIAVMEHLKPVRYWSVVKYPGCVVGKDEPFFPYALRGKNRTVTKLCCSGVPPPAQIGDYDLGPKSFNESRRKTLRLKELPRIVRPRNQFHWLRHALGCWFTARAFSL